MSLLPEASVAGAPTGPVSPFRAEAERHRRFLAARTQPRPAPVVEGAGPEGPLALVVEDDEGTSAALEALLRDNGWRVAATCLGEEAVLDEAAKDYDLMILGAPGSERKEEVFDPMVDYLVRMAPCPTMVTQGRVSERHWPPQRILVPTNGSAASRNAADVAFNLAGEGDAEVTVLNVVSRSEASRRLDRGGEVHRRQMAAARAIVDELCKVGEAMGVRTHTCVREGVAPEAALLELAAKEEADLILLGTDLRPGSERLFLGPRVERILGSAPCPVVVVNGG